MRDDHELIKQVYEAQKKNPIKGDRVKLVIADMNKSEINEENFYTLDKVSAMTEKGCLNPDN